MNKQTFLFVTGDSTAQKNIYETYHFAHWSSAFHIILEKYGYIGFDIKDHNILREPSLLQMYDIIIVTWLPPEMWDETQIESLKAYNGLLFLEGPLPESLNDLSGLKSLPNNKLYEADLLVENKEAFVHLCQNYKVFMVNSMFSLKPKNIRTRKIKESRWEKDFDRPDLIFDELAQRIVKAFRIPYQIRLNKGNLFPDFTDKLLLVYFFSAFCQKGGNILESDRELLWDLFQDLCHEIKSPFETILASETVKELFTDRASTSPLRLDGNFNSHTLRKDFSLNNLKEFIKNHTHLDFVRNRKLKPEFEHLLTQAIMFRSEPDRTQLESIQETLRPHVTTATEIPQLNGDHNIIEVCILSMALEATGSKKSAKYLLNRCLEAGLDFDNGQLKFLTFKDDEIEVCKNFVLSPIVPISFLWVLDSVEQLPLLSETFGETYGKDRIDSWAASPFFIQQTETVDAIQEAVFCREGVPICAGIVRKGKAVTFSFQAFSYIVYYHSMHPLDGPFTDCDASGAMGLTALFFFLLEQQVKRFNATLYKVEAWPDGYSYALTLRHDVDRFPDQYAFDRLLKFEVENGLGVSWYWIFNRLHLPYMKAIEESGNEIGLHGMRHEQKFKEKEILLQTLTRQKSIYGDFIHGGGGGEYWLGYPSIEYGHNCGFEYVEGMSTLYDYPYRFPKLDENGIVEVEDVVCLSHTISVDRHIPPEKQDLWIWNYDRVDSAIKNGFYLMVLNHPDQYYERVVNICTEDLPKEGRLNWTCKQVADWWRGTHCINGISLCMSERSDSSFTIEVTSKQDVEGLVISVALPDYPEESASNNSDLNEPRIKYSASGLADQQIPLNLESNKSAFVKISQ